MDFREEQKISVTWIRWLFILSGVFTLFILFAGVLKEEEAIDMYIAIVIVVPILALTYALVFLTTLTTICDAEGWHYQYPPFVWKKKTLGYADIASWKIIRIRDLLSYGGYGYRIKSFGKHRHVGFIMGSNDAVEFILTNGKKFVFTTLHPAEIQSALRKHAAQKELH